MGISHAKFKHGYDEGLSIVGAPSIPASTTIASVTNATTVVLSQATTNTGSGKAFAIKGPDATATAPVGHGLSS
jgi:hypothetical protein